jgi:hypothetical protein
MKKLLSKRGEGYIDLCVMVLCAMLVIVLALNTFSFFIIKQDLDHYAKEMIRTASVSGRTTGPEIDNRQTELTAETNLTPAVSWDAAYFNITQRTVQLGDTITVTLTYTTQFRGFGLFSVPVTLTAKHSGLSQRYHK